VLRSLSERYEGAEERKMGASDAQRWLERYCSNAMSVRSGIVVLAGESGLKVVSAEWPQGVAGTPELIDAAKAAADSACPVVRGLPPTNEAGKPDRVVSLPLRAGKRSIGAVAVALDTHDSDGSRRALQALEAGASALAPSLAALHPEVPDGAQVLRFLANVLSRSSFAEAATVIAGDLATALRCERVSVGWVDGGFAKVAAVSHVADVNRRQKLLLQLGAVMDEAIEQGAALTYPALSTERPRIRLTHSKLAQRYGMCVCTVPTVVNGRVVGGITLERREAGPFRREEVAFCENLANLIGPILDLMRAAQQPWRERALQSARALGGRIVRPGHPGTKFALGAALAITAALLLVPVPYHVSGPARLEGAIQRALTAPTDGFLHIAHVRPGDEVKEGQVLVELSEQELQLERRKWEAEFAQHDNAFGAALARSDRAQMVIDQAKAAEARAQLELIDQSLARARVQAPFDGVVIKGDLTQSLGAPVQRGETLLTLAPSNDFRLIVEVDERDIADVRVGQNGRVALAALPGNALAFGVARITPVAASANGRNFFEIEGQFEGSSKGLRPGLNGVAKIEAGHASLAWIWTHAVFDWLRLKLWAFGG